MKNRYDQEHPGLASPDAQVDYLKSLVQLRNDENESLKVKLRALEMKTELLERQTERGLTAIDEMRVWFVTRKPMLENHYPQRGEPPMRPDYGIWGPSVLVFLAAIAGAMLDYALHVAGLL